MTATWHHGLVARWWAEVNGPEPEEVAYYATAIRRFGQPALDLGCGTGRILVPMLEQGLDVDGADVSADMLAHAERAGRDAGQDMTGRLVQTSFEELALQRRYRTIVCCDSFGIGGSRAGDARALARIHDRLAPGGAFVFSIDILSGEAAAAMAESDWPDRGRLAGLADGDQLELRTRTASWDPDARVETMEISARLWHLDAVAAEETGTLAFTWYTVEELRVMLRAAGFGEVAVEGRYTGRPATSDDETVVLVARRVS